MLAIIGGHDFRPSADRQKREHLSVGDNRSVRARGKKGSPTIGDNVYIARGRRVLENVGTNVKIGANAVVYQDIPDNAIIVLEPGFKIIPFKGNRAVDE